MRHWKMQFRILESDEPRSYFRALKLGQVKEDSEPQGEVSTAQCTVRVVIPEGCQVPPFRSLVGLLTAAPCELSVCRKGITTQDFYPKSLN